MKRTAYFRFKTRLYTWNVTPSKKSLINTNRKSAFQWAWSSYVAHKLPPLCGLKNAKRPI